MLMNFGETVGVLKSVTNKNWLDYGGDPAHVTLVLWLQLPWRRIALVVPLFMRILCSLNLAEYTKLTPRIYTIFEDLFFLYTV